MYDGSTSWADFWYTNPSYGATGKFTFNVYNADTGAFMASKK